MDMSGTALAATASGTGGGILKVTGTGDFGNSKEAASADSQDTVSISDEARQMVSQMASSSKKSDSASSDDSTDPLGVIRQRMKEIQQEIQKVQESNMPEKEKQRRIQQLSSELMQLNNELLRLEKASGGSTIKGGTPAQGFASSLT